MQTAAAAAQAAAASLHYSRCQVGCQTQPTAAHTLLQEQGLRLLLLLLLLQVVMLLHTLCWQQCNLQLGLLPLAYQNDQQKSRSIHKRSSQATNLP
jgi:hypothetical protein